MTELHLDIGTTAVRGTLLRSRAEIAGFVSLPSAGVHKSEIVDPDVLAPIVAEVHRALTARLSTPPQIFVNSSRFVSAKWLERTIPIAERATSAQLAALDAILEEPGDGEVVYATPTEYRFDDGDWTDDPIPHRGTVLTARSYVVSLRGGGQDVRAVLHRAGIEPLAVIPSPMHAALRLIPPIDRDNVAVIDLGAGSTKIYATERGRIVHLEVIPREDDLPDEERVDALLASIGERLEQRWRRATHLVQPILTGGLVRALPDRVEQAAMRWGMLVTVDRALAPGRRRDIPGCILIRRFGDLL